jgi:hypothetical protein
MRGRFYVRVLPFVVCLVILSRGARADEASEKAACISASDEGQQLRDDGKYTLAREAFERCARESCPVLLRIDCVHWLLDLDQSSASVVINAKDDKGNDLVDVTVTVDGQPFASKLDGKPLAVDPGAHLFHYEAAGFAPMEEHAVIHAAEKNRALNVRFPAALTVSRPPPVETPPIEGPDQARVASPPPPPPVPETVPPSAAQADPRLPGWVFAGVSVVAFASEAYFGLTGLSQRSTDLALTGCATEKDCAPSEKSSIQTKFAVADVSLGVGLVSAGLAAYFFLRPIDKPAVAIDLAPRQGGWTASISGSF